MSTLLFLLFSSPSTLPPTSLQIAHQILSPPSQPPPLPPTFAVQVILYSSTPPPHPPIHTRRDQIPNNRLRFQSDHPPRAPWLHSHRPRIDLFKHSLRRQSSRLSPPNPSRLGFFLITVEAVIQTMVESNDSPDTFCVLDSRYMVPLFTFQKLSPPPQASFSDTSKIEAPSEYSPFFANCNPQMSVSMSVRTEMYNVDNGVSDRSSVRRSHFVFPVWDCVFCFFWQCGVMCVLRIR